jgi:hypothetical protein
LDSPRQGLTLGTPGFNGGETYQGQNYQWSVAIGAPQGTDQLAGTIRINSLF